MIGFLHTDSLDGTPLSSAAVAALGCSSLVRSSGMEECVGVALPRRSGIELYACGSDVGALSIPVGAE
jgi:hypothetical protein